MVLNKIGLTEESLFHLFQNQEISMEVGVVLLNIIIQADKLGVRIQLLDQGMTHMNKSVGVQVMALTFTEPNLKNKPTNPNNSPPVMVILSKHGLKHMDMANSLQQLPMVIPIPAQG